MQYPQYQQYSQYPQQVDINPGSNMTFSSPTSFPMASAFVREESGLIGGDLVSSLTQAQFNSAALAQSQSNHLTMSSFPLTTINPQVLIPNSGIAIAPSIIPSNNLSTYPKRLVPVDPEVIQQLQAPGQPFIGAQPEPQTKVLLQTMDHYGSYNIFSFLDVHYPQSHCTLIPNKLYNKYRW